MTSPPSKTGSAPACEDPVAKGRKVPRDVAGALADHDERQERWEQIYRGQVGEDPSRLRARGLATPSAAAGKPGFRVSPPTRRDLRGRLLLAWVPKMLRATDRKRRLLETEVRLQPRARSQAAPTPACARLARPEHLGALSSQRSQRRKASGTCAVRSVTEVIQSVSPRIRGIFRPQVPLDP